jgi:outer membrane protein OmpA-like peptidoglycan-associated protein
MRDTNKIPAILASLLAASILASSSAALAADLPGSKDPLGLQRFDGSDIIHYATSSYQPYFLARDVAAIGDEGFAKSDRIEGATVRAIYRVPEGTSSLEVFRNYEQMLSDAGFQQDFEIATGRVGEDYSAQYFLGKFYFQGQMTARFNHEGSPFTGIRDPYYVTAKGTKDGREVHVAVLVGESTGTSWEEAGAASPFAIKPGQVVVGLDVITSKTIAARMVTIKADDLAKALAVDGKVEIYNILFDIDKTDLKPESNAALAEVAKLLQSDPALKLEVAGHTDNTGDVEHNLDLSVGRANAVVDALAARYGIDKARLQAQGYGETMPIATNETDAGRSKNRRVELKKI